MSLTPDQLRRRERWCEEVRNLLLFALSALIGATANSTWGHHDPSAIGGWVGAGVLVVAAVASSAVQGRLQTLRHRRSVEVTWSGPFARMGAAMLSMRNAFTTATGASITVRDGVPADDDPRRSQ